MGQRGMIEVKENQFLHFCMVVYKKVSQYSEFISFFRAPRKFTKLEHLDPLHCSYIPGLQIPCFRASFNAFGSLALNSGGTELLT